MNIQVPYPMGLGGPHADLKSNCHRSSFLLALLLVGGLTILVQSSFGAPREIRRGGVVVATNNRASVPFSEMSRPGTLPTPLEKQRLMSSNKAPSPPTLADFVWRCNSAMTANEVKLRLLIYADVPARTLENLMNQRVDRYEPFRGKSNVEVEAALNRMSVRDGVLWLIREAGANGVFLGKGLIVLSPTDG